MTLHVLRIDGRRRRLLPHPAVGDARRGRNVTTDEFIGLAEQISGQELDDLFETWLFTAGKPTLDPTTPTRADGTRVPPPGAAATLAIAKTKGLLTR